MSQENFNDDNATIICETLEKDFVIFARALCQDPDLSSDGHLVLNYLLSLPKYKKDENGNLAPWKINLCTIWKNKNISRNRVYNAVKELIELGYMQKNVLKKGNLNNGFQYRVASFKKFFRHSEFQEAENGSSENAEHIKNIVKKNIDKKEHSPPKPPIEKSADSKMPDENTLFYSPANREEPRQEQAPKVERSKPPRKERPQRPDQEIDEDEPQEFGYLKTLDEQQYCKMLCDYKPLYGPKLQISSVSFWINNWGLNRVKEVLVFYEEKIAAYKQNPNGLKKPASMGAIMRDALNRNLKADSDPDIVENRSYCQEKAKTNSFIELTKDYCKISFGRAIDELKFSMPSNLFKKYLDQKIENAQAYV